MRLVLLGLPASGKGTLGKSLSEHYNLPLIGVGQVLRDIPKDHPRYLEINDYMAKGKLVPVDFLGNYLSELLSGPAYNSGYILDGWLRQLADLSVFDPKPDHVLYLKITEETAKKRIDSRLVCTAAGHTYNLLVNPPKNDGICDIDGSPLTKRSDDNGATMIERFKVFHTQTTDVIEHYYKSGVLIEINAEPLPDIVLKSTIDKLEQVV